MSEPGGWTTPEGWGPPSGQPPQPPGGAPQQPPYGQPPYGQPYGAAEVKPGVVPLRPLGLGELLDGAVGVLRRYPRPTLGFAAVVAIVATVVNTLLLVTAYRPFVDLDEAALEAGDTEALESALGGVAAGGLLSLLLTLLSTAVLTGVLTAVVGRAVLGQAITIGEAWAQVRPRLGRLLGLALLLAIVPFLVLVAATAVAGVLLALAGGGVVLAIPFVLAGLAGAVYLYIRWSLAPSVLVLEKTGTRESLRRSSVLVKGDWWRVFGISVLALLIAVFVSLVIQVPFELLGAGSIGDLAGSAQALSARAVIASALGSIVAATLVDPFTAGVRALLYVDRRMRAEGLDVALTAAANEQR
jgi:hypothetical protein